MSLIAALVPAMVLLTAGIVAILLARPLRASPIVGYIVAGMALGPHGFDVIPEGDTTRVLAELGVVFLLFEIGLTFSVRHVWDARRDILGLGPMQVALATIVFGSIAMAMGLPLRYAVVVGATLSLSSSAAVVQTLAERGTQSCPVGLTATAILIFQDVAAIFVLILLVSLGETTQSLAGALAAAALKAAFAFAAAVAIGRYVIGSLFALLSRSRNNEIFTATALLVVLATGAGTARMGLSLELGAFLGGMMIAETPYRQLIQTEIKPFRGLLLGFFFITVGMSLAPQVVLADGGWLLLFLVGYVTVKAVTNSVASLAFRWSVPGSVQLGLLLAQGDEFAFVILADAGLRAALGERATGVIITGVAASLAVTPALAAAGRALASRLRALAPPARPAGAAVQAGIEPVVIVGLGDIGRTVADGLEASRVPYAAIEFDPDRFAAARVDGYPVAFGDPGDLRLMETLELDKRSVVVVTIVRYEVSAALTPVMRDRYPNTVRFIAVETEEDRARFAALGMRPVLVRSVPKGLDLAEAVLVSQGVARRAIAAWMRREQERALQSLRPPTAGTAVVASTRSST